ncbi:hypothetical protein [Chryseobacterium sp. ERMR1:04]|uniref:hypothetical protein n=1 Tax=Chryseobacterium sp. ERMR1:04 TaxID=1705393 RepID=UPI0006C8A82A|nr:hypothetical protein [Chryseobacterium sp. ERMR1:04]KPH14865.1 hypothetical protein AMQ68_05420 [Chryseobacterium sp. ERMR1:04]
MENTENKNIEKITNEELFQEFKRRGFYIIPNEIKPNRSLNYIVVAVEKPNCDIFVDYKHDIEKYRTGSDETDF